MFDLVGRLVTAHPGKICVAWLAGALGLFLVAPAWDAKVQDDDIRFLPARCPSVRGYRLMEKAFPEDVSASRAVFAVERPDRRLTDRDFALVDQMVTDLEGLARREPGLKIGKVFSYRDPVLGGRLTSADGHCTLIQASLGAAFLAEQTRRTMDRAEQLLRLRLALAGKDVPRLYATGTAGIGRDMSAAAAGSLDGTTLATVALVVVILLWVYRAPLLALVPLLTIAGSVVVALRLLALLTLLPGVHLVNVTKVFAIVILYGAGTDYCLFLISRYREELEAGHDTAEALRRSLAAVGGALTASAGTVMCGLGLMVFAEFAKVRYGGPAIALGLGVALLAALTLAPALLRLIGPRVFWPAGVPRPRPRAAGSPGAEGFWARMSGLVANRPVLVWSAAVLILLPLALVGLRARSNYRATGELPPSSRSIQGVAAVQRHFTAGETGPITVLLASPTSWAGPEGRELIDHLCRCFRHLPNVAEVRCLTRPLGEPPPTTAPAPVAKKGLLDQLVRVVVQPAVLHKAQEHYLATVPGENGPRSVTRLDVVLKSDPFDPLSVATLQLIQTFLEKELPRCPLPAGGVESECYGVTANAQDLARVTEADRGRINLLTLGGILLVLVLLVHKPWLAVYLLATVLLSYFATLGATLLAGSVVSGRPLHQVDWRVPFFLFTILVAVGEDYNILLVTRVLQERLRYGSGEGIRRALARTGGTISSCGLIMAGTFATLMLAGLGTLKQIGFALAFGVLLDTFVVRPFLVPAFILMVWRSTEGRAERPAVRRLPKPARLRRAG